MAGATPSKPARYGVLWNNNFYLGMVTQRNPLRSNLQHVEEEFYGSQVCLIDGLNTEISTDITLIRRPGTSSYNSPLLIAPPIPGPITRFYENRVSIFNATQTASTESIQILADCPSSVRDVTGPSGSSLIFGKVDTLSSTYFQSVGNELFFSVGPNNKKLITPNLIWAPSQTLNTGNQILDPNGNLQIVQGTGTATITEIAVVGSTLGVVGGPTIYFLKITFSSDVFWTEGTSVSFSGATTYTEINNQAQTVVVNPTYLTPSSTVAYFTTGATATYGPAADTGTASTTMSTGSGISGSSAPAWIKCLAVFSTDNQLTWPYFWHPLYNWAVPAPTLAPFVSIAPGNRYWQPNFTISSSYYAILDSNGNIQLASAGTTGVTLPIWNTVYRTSTTVGGFTSDSGVTWFNAGPLGSWAPNQVYLSGRCILDSNQNIQLAYGVTDGTSGATVPSVGYYSRNYHYRQHRYLAVFRDPARRSSLKECITVTVGYRRTEVYQLLPHPYPLVFPDL